MAPRSRPGKIITFYSYKGGTGRSMALANAAWILASNGYQVLAVDWDLEAPGLHRYFHPFLLDPELSDTPGVLDMVWDVSTAAMDPATPERANWHEPYADVLNYAVSLRRKFPAGGTLDLLPSGRQGPLYSTRVGAFDWTNFYDRLGGGAFLEAVRASMRAEYDYVLIDSRTGLSDTSGICTVQLPDVLVVGFTFNTQSVSGAAAVTESVRRQRPDLRILPVPMRVEDGERPKLERGRDFARARFGDLPTRMDDLGRTRYWGEVEIPYRTFYAYEEILAPIGDRPGVTNSVLSACERLVSHLTDGVVSESAPLEETQRRALLLQLERATVETAADFLISHVSEDRQWAEWLRWHLMDRGYTIVNPSDLRIGSAWDETVTTTAATALVVMSPAYLTSRSLEQIPAEMQRRLLPVLVTDMRLPSSLRSKHALTLVEVDEITALSRLDKVLKALPPPSAAAGPPQAEAPRFPGALPAVWNMPPRNTALVGRRELLGELSQRLPDRPVVLVGLGGIGKTAVAVEYAHLNAADYDLVWWIDAAQPAQRTDQLIELGRQLEWETGDTVQVWDLTAGARIRELRTSDAGPVVAVACTQLDGQPIAVTAGRDHTVQIWDLTNGARIRELRTSDAGPVVAVACTQLDGQPIAVIAGRDHTVQIWDLTNGARIRELRTSDAGPVVAVACTQLDGQPIAVIAGRDHTVQIWDLTNGARIRELRTGDAGPVVALACTQLDGRPVAVIAGSDHTVRTWDLTNGAQIRWPRISDASAVVALACTQLYGRPVAVTAGSDHTMRTWDLTNGAQIREPRISGAGPVALACTELDGRPIAITVVAGVDRDNAVRQVLGALRTRRRWLLIFDDADDPTVLRPLTSVESGHVLITSRNASWRRIADVVEVGVLARPESVELLQRQIPAVLAELADELAALLGDLPLALNAAAAFIAATGTPAAEYLQLFQTHRVELLDRGNVDDTGSVSATVRLAMDRLRAELGIAAALLELLSFFGPAPIPLKLFQSGGTEIADDKLRRALASPIAFAELIGSIGRYSLAARVGDALQVHRLVQAVVRDSLPTDSRLSYSWQVEGLLGAAAPGKPQEPATWPAYTELLPHIAAVETCDDVRFRGLLLDTGWYLYYRGDPVGCRQLARSAAGRFTSALGDDADDTLSALHLIAIAAWELGDYAEAAELNSRLLIVRDRLHGPDAPDTLSSRSNLALSLAGLGDADGALRVEEEVLSRRQRVLGADHPHTLASLGNLADRLLQVGDVARARAVAEERIVRSQRILGTDHPSTLIALNNLAVVLRADGDVPGSVELYRSVVAERRRVLGPQHPDTLNSTYNLAVALVDLQGPDDAQAQSLAQEAVAGLTHLYGYDHPLAVRARELAASPGSGWVPGSPEATPT